MDVEQMDFCEIPTIGGNKIQVCIIPKGNSWGEGMGVDNISAYLQVGPPKYDKFPANSVFIRDEMCDLNSFKSRLFELLVIMDFFILKDAQGCTVHQTKENFMDEFMDGYSKYWNDRHNKHEAVGA